MATPNVAIPPMDKISIIGIWMESVIYGFNCIIFGFCMFVLLRGEKAARPRVLILASTILFILCTVHVAVSLQQLLEAFAYAPADVPNYSNLYWLNSTPMLVLKDVLYVTLVFIQDIILIWRLYMVFNRNWKIVIVPIVMEAAHMATAYAATVMYAVDPSIGLYDSVLSRLGLMAWALDIIINTSLTLTIAARLWWMGHVVASLSASRRTRDRYLVAANVIIGSGCLFAGATVIMVGLYVNNSSVTLTGLDVACQLAVLTPLLIVVKIGLESAQDLQDENETIHRLRTAGPRITKSNSFERGLATAGTEDQIERTSMSTNPRSFMNDMKV